MQVVHAFVKTMEVPVERMKFDPDPLRINEEPDRKGLVVRNFECLEAHLASIKAQAAGLGIELSGETLLDKEPALPIAVTPPWPAAHAASEVPAAQQPAGIPAINMITAFDVHGGAGKQAREQEATEETESSAPLPPLAPVQNSWSGLEDGPPRERTWITFRDLAADYDVPSVALYVVFGLSYFVYGAAWVLRAGVRTLRWTGVFSGRPRLKVVAE